MLSDDKKKKQKKTTDFALLGVHIFPNWPEGRPKCNVLRVI